MRPPRGKPFERRFDPARPPLQPTRLRLEAATVCQLRCPSCPTAEGVIRNAIGAGWLTIDRFRELVDANPFLREIELSNWGEVFLNPDLLKIFEHAHSRGVRLTISNGANLNDVRDEVLEGLVRFGIRQVTCSIDGATPETYAIYRRRGHLDRVLRNIETINRHKAAHRSPYPRLDWQFVAFGHNEHEIPEARRLAARLGMGFRVKLSWGDLYGEDFSPVQDRDLVARESGTSAADRAEFERRHGTSYVAEICHQLWIQPQVNFDGRLLGCCVNHWGDFGNVFESGLLPAVNGEKMRYAREMLQGRAPARPDIPCSTCSIYGRMSETSRWVNPDEVTPSLPRRLLRPLLSRLSSLFRHARRFANRPTGASDGPG
ncbi:MAG: radical SAM protein [Acidobacteriota bacterium]